MSKQRGVGILAGAVLLIAAQGAQATSAFGWFSGTLWAGDIGQKAKLYHARDTDCGPSDCVSYQFTGPAKQRFPAQALRIGSDPQAVRIDLRLERQRPIRVLRYWGELDEDGKPIGEPTPIEHHLRRTGATRWSVEFTTPPLEPKAFIDLRAHWPDDLGTTSFARFGLHLAE